MFQQLQIPWSEAHLPLLLTVVRSRIRQVSLRFLTPYDVTHQQFQVLALLERSPGICHKDLAGALGLDKPTATRILQALQRKGWIEVRSDPKHGRRLRIDLSETGRALMAELGGFRQFFREGLETGLSPEERQTLRDLLQRLMLNLDRLEALSPLSK